MPTVTQVNDLKINKLTKAQYEAAVQAGTIGENEISIITDLDATPQVDVLPTAAASQEGKIYQYMGTTDANYTNGYFYKCVSDGAVTPTYSWIQVNVQPAVDPLPSQSGNTGKFLTTDGTDASWTAIYNMPYSTYNSNSISYGVDRSGSYMSKTTVAGLNNSLGNNNYQQTVFGSNNSVSAGSTVIGADNSASSSTNVIVIGSGNKISNNCVNAVMLGDSSNNLAAITSSGIYWSKYDTRYEIVSSDGTIPAARHASVSSATQGQVLALDSNLKPIWTNASSSGSVSSVNGQTGDVVLNAYDTQSVPQCAFLPEADYEYIDNIVQYVGNDVLSTPTIKQTYGDSFGVELEVDAQTFMDKVNNIPGNYYFWCEFQGPDGSYGPFWYLGMLDSKDRSIPVDLAEYGISHTGQLFDAELRVTLKSVLQNGCFYKCVDTGEYINEATIEHTGPSEIETLTVDSETFGDKVEHEPGEYNFYTDGMMWFTDPNRMSSPIDSMQLYEQYGIELFPDYGFTEEDVLTVTYEYNEGGIKWEQQNVQPVKEYSAAGGIVVDNKNNVIKTDGSLLQNYALNPTSFSIGYSDNITNKDNDVSVGCYAMTRYGSGGNTVVGNNATSTTTNGVAIGSNTSISGSSAIAIGHYASVHKANSIMLNSSGLTPSNVNNIQPAKFYVKTSPENGPAYEMMSADGTIPTGRLTTLLEALYPVGSLYLGTQSTCPLATLLPNSTWTLVAANKALWTGDGINGDTTVTNVWKRTA